MWQIRSDRTDNTDVVVVTATWQDGSEIFSHKEAISLKQFNVSNFANKAISERNAWRSKNTVFANNLSTISENILKALHTAEGIKADVSVVAENGAIFVKKVEAVKEIEVMEKI